MIIMVLSVCHEPFVFHYEPVEGWFAEGHVGAWETVAGGQTFAEVLGLVREQVQFLRSGAADATMRCE